MATISAVLYANTNHPELKIEYINWTDRCKQILKKWRALTNDQKAPFLQQARDNRSALRLKKAHQVCDRFLWTRGLCPWNSIFFYVSLNYYNDDNDFCGQKICNKIVTEYRVYKKNQ